MRLVRLSDGRLVLARRHGFIDVAAASGDPALGTLNGLLRAGAERVRFLDGADVAPLDTRDLASPVDAPAKIICVGRNYSDHMQEMGHETAPWPETFLRLPTGLIGPYADIQRPAVTSRLDYEGELALVIGTAGRHIPADRALEHVFGLTVANDVSVRDWQHRGQQWTPGKNFDGTLPLGPHLVSIDRVDPSDLAIETRVNGEVVQSARTSQLIFDLPHIIEFVSSWTTLIPGDLILTGTPGGVGVARDPPLLLTDGDMVEVEVQDVGAIRNLVRDDGLAPATERWAQEAAGARTPGAR